MNRKPRSRRVGFIATLILAVLGIPYYILLQRAAERTTPPAFLQVAGLIGGTLIAAGLAFFMLSVLFSARATAPWLSILSRLLFFSICTALFLLALLGLASPLLEMFLTHLGLALITLMLMIALSAQFSLPVKGGPERIAVLRRLLGFLAGERGPVTFLRNGEVIEAHGERARRGPGVLLIDYASAAVLRTDVKLTRAVGPGLVFTESGERIEEAVDLRRQMRKVDGFTPPAGEAAALESTNSLAVTKDGIPVSTDLSVQFMLDPGDLVAPHEGRIAKKPPFPWKLSAVEKAVYGHAYGESEDIPWTELPLRLTIDLWREIVKEKTLKELTTFSEGTDPPLERVKFEILQRFTRPVEEGQDGKGEESDATSRESRILQQRGIRILDVGISHLHLPEDVHLERMQNWRHDWVSDIQAALSEAQDEADRAAFDGEVKAGELLFESLTSTLLEQLEKGSSPNKRDTIRCILKDAVELCSKDDKIEDSVRFNTSLLDIAKELANLDKDCREMGPES